LADNNIVTINNRTGNQVQLTDIDGSFVNVPAYGSATGALDDATYAKAVAIFGAANVTLASSVAGGISTASVPVPDWVPPIPSSAGYTPGNITMQQAILVELRVISLLLQQNSAPNVDLASLRADEVNNATGGVFN
jgi:hypothetical protein